MSRVILNLCTIVLACGCGQTPAKVERADDLKSDLKRATSVPEQVSARGVSDAQTGLSAGDSKAVICCGDSFSEALKVFGEHGISILETHLDVEASDAEPFTLFMASCTIKPEDALFLLVIPDKKGDGMVIDEMYWHVDWLNESAHPKSSQQGKRRSITSVDVRDLDLPFGEPKKQPPKPIADPDPSGDNQ